MTDSTTNNNPGDVAFDVGSSVDELFGESEAGDDPGAERRTPTEHRDTTTMGEDTDGVEDRTAAEVFDQLRADATETNGADDILAEESPEDIIASANEPEPEPKIADELLADDDELADLLLTERTKGEEFLWVKTDSSTTSSASSNGNRKSASNQHLSEARDRRRRPKDVEFDSDSPGKRNGGANAAKNSNSNTSNAEPDDASESDDEESSGLIGGIRSILSD
ncbi:hypothetical protein [Natrinema halophilum]|uniref:Uncharacterized protein n=1 Tax=Natrinema halophilum TaxID=1699371 RepID=A0A7D5KWS5_9EURY|nr:hypothetical protein [Natrinema halophilum]QLG47962.1 hypothetical protein HYG82_03445 [Natrinema halophilum]